MRVLVLHSELGTLRGGGENFTRNLFASFVSLGHEVSAAFTADPFGRYPFQVPAGITAIPIRGWWSRSFGHGTLSAVNRRLTVRSSLHEKWEYIQNGVAWRTVHWHNRRFQRRILGRIEPVTWNVDAVYVHGDHFLASEVARIRPTVLRLPGPVTSEVLPALRKIHAVCANGDALKCIRSFMPDAIELPVGLDYRRFAQGSSSCRERLGWTSEHKVVGYVGRLSRIKGVDILAEGFRALSTSRPDARLLFVGTGEEENNLRAILKREAAKGLVYFAGDVAHEELPLWYRAMDVLVMPSRYENYSNAILEALACAVPFVGSEVGGNRALYDAGVGWLFERDSPASLTNVLYEALADGEKRRALGQEGRAYVEGRYSWAATARRLEDILKIVVEEEKIGPRARKGPTLEAPAYSGARERA
jgi:glycosyltransferase involved in cell wall biosynthesis